MKNLLPALALSCSILFACQKKEDLNPADTSQLTNVTFSVSDFSQSDAPINKSSGSILALGDTLRNHADYLYAYIFSSNGSAAPVYLEQTSASATFGTISASLTPGPYIAVFVASRLPTNFNGITRYSSLSMQPGMEDIFITNQYSFTVGAEAKTESVRLTRWTGAVEVNIEDAIPTNASKILIETPDDSSGWVFSAGQYTGADNTSSFKEFALTSTDKGQVNRKFLMYIFNQSSGMVFKIKAFDSQNVLIAEKTVNNVSVQRNRKTLLSGKLFSSTTSFSITVNPYWAAPGNIVSF